MSERRAPRMKIMLDSGAYSAWTRGETIPVEEYILFIQQHRAELDTYINLDFIPGDKGRRPTLREVQHAAEVSFANYEAMRAAGLDPIPVFHYGEGFEWLERLLDAGAGYICLGGTVGVPTAPKRKFLDECFTILTNARGEPLVKTHGLGVTEGKFLVRYPWQSVDSTSWLIAPTYGMILVPGLIAGDFSSQIYIADGHLAADKDGRRFERLPLAAQDHVLEFARECGVTITDLRNDVHSRTLVFVSCLLRMREHVPATFKYRRNSFGFSGRGPGRAPAAVDFRMIFAGGLTNVHQRAILRRCGAQHHLRSYYEHRRDPDSFVRYVEALNSAAPYDVEDRAAPKTDWQSMNYHDYRRRLLATRAQESEDEPEVIA